MSVLVELLRDKNHGSYIELEAAARIESLEAAIAVAPHAMFCTYHTWQTMPSIGDHEPDDSDESDRQQR